MLRMTSQEYKDAGGTQCPYCRVEDIVGVGIVESDAGIAWQSMRCNVCGARWTDEYVLKGYAEDVKPAVSDGGCDAEI